MSSDPAPTLVLERAQRKTLAQSVAQQLLEAIRSRQLKPGDRMPSERELMSALGVGRSTIREALNGLALLGVVEVRQGQGVLVAEPSKTEEPSALGSAMARARTRDLLEARDAAEMAIVRLAAARRTSDDLVELEELVTEYEREIAKDEGIAPARTLELATRFHGAVADAAHNEVLATVMRSIVKSIMVRGTLPHEDPAFRRWEAVEHRGIYEAIRDGDVERASSLMRAHIDAMSRVFERVGEL